MAMLVLGAWTAIEAWRAEVIAATRSGGGEGRAGGGQVPAAAPAPAPGTSVLA